MKEIKQLKRRIELQEELVTINEAKVLNREALLSSAKDVLAGEQTILENMKRQLSILETYQTFIQVNNN